MRLLVISATPHHRDADGTIVGWGPTVRELDELASRFDELVHVAPLHDGPAPASAQQHRSARVRVRLVRPAGGTTIRDKLGILVRIPGWARAIRAEMRSTDVLHVRAPSNLALIALVMASAARHPRVRWMKYGGNWAPSGPEPASYRAQRWILRSGACRATVTVNGAWPRQPAHVHSFVNPTLTDDQLRLGAEHAAGKSLDGPMTILFAGRLDAAKGAGRVIDIAARLERRQVPFRLHLAGDGPDRDGDEATVAREGLATRVTFHGWLTRDELDGLYADAHVVLLPSASEGFPKVLAEGMANGAVPLAGDVSGIGAVLAEAGTGRVLPVHDVDAFADAIDALRDPERWRRERDAAVRAASRFGYRAYLTAVEDLFRSEWGLELDPAVAGSSRTARAARVDVYGAHLGGNAGWTISQGEVLVELLREQGHEVHHASTRPRRAARVVDTARTVMRRGKSADVAVVDVFSGPAFAMAELTVALVRSRGVPVVLVLHGGALPSFADRHPRRVGRLLGQASVVVSPSPFLARSLHHLRDDITVIPNQLPLRAYPASTRGPARPRLLWMRTLHPIYRPDLALAVLREVRRAHPSATLTLAGQDKGLLRETQRQAAALGLGDAVAFPGFLGPDAKRCAFEDHDIFLSTSAIDNAPVSVLEAAASGLIVVAMDVGGLRDLVVDGESGVLVRDGDVPAMAGAVGAVLDDPARARSLSVGARRLGSATSRAAIAAAWEECLARAVRS